MKNKLVFLLFSIYILTTLGCEDAGKCTSDYYLEIDAPSLVSDENGYYRFQFVSRYVQTFTTLRAQTGSIDTYQKLGWMSNKEININGHWTNLVNPATYTDDEGTGYTVLGVWQEFIGDTITVYCAYKDECQSLYTDTLKVIME